MTHRQERALQSLLECPTMAQAAQAAGVGVSSLRRWLKQDTEFMAAYQQAAKEALEHATKRAQAATGAAIDVLQTIMEDTEESAQARISAADRLLSHTLKLTEAVDLVGRLDALERLADGGEQP